MNVFGWIYRLRREGDVIASAYRKFRLLGLAIGAFDNIVQTVAQTQETRRLPDGDTPPWVPVRGVLSEVGRTRAVRPAASEVVTEAALQESARRGFVASPLGHGSGQRVWAPSLRGFWDQILPNYSLRNTPGRGTKRLFS